MGNSYHVGDTEDALNAKNRVINSEPRRRPVAQRAAEIATRKTIAAAQAEVMREVLAKLISVVYETDENGRLWNITRDGRIDGVLMPWSNRGYKEWGVRRTHAKILRYTMVRRPSPFSYNGSDSRWYLNLQKYPTADHAYRWLDGINLDADLWNDLIESWRNR